MPPRTVQAVLVPLALILPVLVLLVLLMAAAVSAEDGGGVDPEVTVCRQQCARQRQFSAAERRYCLRQCDEHGRAKRREEEREEDAEREHDRCLHECRAGPPKPGCERRCREAYDRAAGNPRARGRRRPAGSVVGWWQVEAAVA